MTGKDAAGGSLRGILDEYYYAWFRYHPEAAVDAGLPVTRTC